MIEWEETETGLRVYDRTKTEVPIDARGWERTDERHDIDRPVDATVSGFVSELRLPAAVVRVLGLESGEEYQHGGDTTPLELPDDDYLLDVSLNIKTYLRFSGRATVWKSDDFNDLYLRFPEPTLLTFGFRSHHEEPVDTITVAPTPSGVAEAVTHLPSSHKVSGPERSYPNLRGHPPKVELGERTEIPERVRRERFETGIELVVPDDLRYVFVAAPLAYYLQARLRVADRGAPVLRAPEGDVDRAFAPLPCFQHEVADLLRRVFFLDCLVRNAGEYSWELAELPLLDRLDVDAESTYRASPAERLATYLDAAYERIDDDLPEWHLSMYVDPVPGNATMLPYFLDSLSLVYLPESSDLEKNELLNRSIDDFYRAKRPAPDAGTPETATAEVARGSSGPVKSVDRRDPVLHEGRVHGWLAEGVPIDVFKVVPEAYENRFKYLDQTGGDIDVTVILNDEEMADEHEEVANIYRERAKDLPIDVTVHEYLRKDELADVLESRHDFVHYIGHCEADGLRCSNGHLPVSDIEESNVQTFFLNACGSYYEGRDLVRRGSVAGAVTFTKVLNKQAVKVGVAFARLLINGYSIAHALHLARRRIMTGKDYAVVGDGSRQLTQCDNRFPVFATLERIDGRQFTVSLRNLPLSSPGGCFQIYDDRHDELYLNGATTESVFSQEELLTFLERAKMPLVYDGTFYWSDELREKLTN
ncbi:MULTISPECIES: hypothetical protein [Halorussus]|uniref:hypothetical protein n=1 Tax=Halorussus TaxID=1070314 RepID=UPI0020A173B0|nr:hypothetical protein [Halorussus vallis]